MPRNFIDLHLNYDEIRARISQDKGKLRHKEWAEKIQVSPSLIAQIHPKVISQSTKQPSLEYVIAVALYTGKSIRWYLFGKEGPPPLRVPPEGPGGIWHHPLLKDPCFWNKWTPESVEVCSKVKRILDSDHPHVKPLLLTGVDCFLNVIDSETTKAKKQTP